ncbi:hypothetical protein [Streptomyces canus]|uniref:hypothetical protein n=1 Tax=Streptomyces canus TaxID=58343 RepID=UPI002259D73F|nr:hypothetical protein [Streptomyces canus]MCX4858579.1 hypothetical protein [Streptomyces canus]
MDLGGEHTEVGGRLLQWSRATEWVTREWRQVLVLAVAAASYELGVVTDGSGFIAAWVVSWAGMAVAASAVLVAGRRLVRGMDVPPAQQAAMKWRQAEEASRAGMQAWQSTSDAQS